jgi:hypothetical protein
MPPPTERTRLILLSGLLFFLGVVAFQPVLNNDFLINWDDQRYVLLNNHVQHGFTREDIKWAFKAQKTGIGIR